MLVHSSERKIVEAGRSWEVGYSCWVLRAGDRIHADRRWDKKGRNHLWCNLGRVKYGKYGLPGTNSRFGRWTNRGGKDQFGQNESERCFSGASEENSQGEYADTRGFSRDSEDDDEGTIETQTARNTQSVRHSSTESRPPGNGEEQTQLCSRIRRPGLLVQSRQYLVLTLGFVDKRLSRSYLPSSKTSFGLWCQNHKLGMYWRISRSSCGRMP